jgi:hydroxypyruvate isomerase
MKLTPCLEMLFRELPFVDRIAAVADCGYTAAEFWGHAGKDLTAIAAAAAKHGVTITSLSACGDLVNPARHDQAVQQLEEAIAAARVVSCERLIVMSGNTIPGTTRCAHVRNCIAGLKRLAPVAEEAGVTLVLELLNTRVDHFGYFLDNSEDLAAILRAVDHPCVKGLYDIYHGGIMEGNVTESIRSNIDIIGHLHAAGIPGRHELMDGEQNYPFLCRQIDAMGYTGYMGLEYAPLKPSRESLIETRLWLSS